MPLQKPPCKRFEMYIPTYPMDPYRRFRNALADNFGGYTEMPMGVGAWKSPDSGEVIHEGVSVFVVVLAPDRERELMDLLMTYKDDANQQAVMLTSTPVDVVML